MAKSQSVATLCTLLLFIFLLAASEVSGADPYPCTKRSQTWFGVCLNSNGCNNQCITWEKAVHGACHQSGFGFACFCYYYHC
ncbi:Defensin-like protein 19 [Nymphaea thermarum]|nr:Defensin-like protein 19 [Nymphaea thermarum]